MVLAVSLNEMMPFVVFLVIVFLIWKVFTVFSQNQTRRAKRDGLEAGPDPVQLWLEGIKRASSKQQISLSRTEPIPSPSKADAGPASNEPQATVYAGPASIEPQAIANALPTRATVGELWRQFVAAVFVVGAAWLIYDGVSGKILPHERMQEAYVSTKAAVLETAIDDGFNLKGRAVFNPRVRLRYNAFGSVREEWCQLDWSTGFA